MERWNELIAGYVLGNLTTEENEELAQVLAKHPQLNESILRLRQTATLRGCVPENRITDHTVPLTIQATDISGYMTKGSEGWTDGISGGPSSAPLKSHPHTAHSILDQGKHTLHGRALNEPSSYPHPKNNSNGHTWLNTCAKNSVQNPLWWLLVLATIGLGIDNMRVRRSLALIKDKSTYTHMEKMQPTLWNPADNQLKTQ